MFGAICCIPFNQLHHQRADCNIFQVSFLDFLIIFRHGTQVAKAVLSNRGG